MTKPPTFDAVIHAPNRLQICAFLAPLTDAEFPTLRDTLGVSDSVLSKHLRVLEESGYVKIKKATVDSRVRTRVSLTTAGRRAYRNHIAALQVLVSVDPAVRLEPSG